MGDLSAHFDSSEFKDPVTGECKMNPSLIIALEALRSIVGRPIHIDSGYRSPGTNESVGGVSHSQHIMGNAADISVEGMDTWQLYVAADQLLAFRHGGVGIYPGENFIHVDVRGERARWARMKGTYVAVEQAIEAHANGRG